MKKLIVGLGNPGPQYELTRHNLGFLVADSIVDAQKVSFKKCSFTNGLLARFFVDEDQVFVLKPVTYMNRSGGAVKNFVDQHGIQFSDILIVCDDLNLGFGQLRLRPSGSAGGHNGLKSIIACLQSQDFSRLRMGIQHPGSSDQVVDYVLGDFDRQEQKQLGDFVEQACQCCLGWVQDGVDRTMEIFNRKEGKGKS